jgi:hypothetical protein
VDVACEGVSVDVVECDLVILALFQCWLESGAEVGCLRAEEVLVDVESAI